MMASVKGSGPSMNHHHKVLLLIQLKAIDLYEMTIPDCDRVFFTWAFGPSNV